MATRQLIAHAFGVGFLITGGLGTAGLMVLLHSGALESNGEAQVDAVTFDAAPKKKPPQRKKPRPKPKSRPKPSKAPPPPSLGASLAGMSFGLPGYDASLLGGAQDSLLGDRSSVVMTEDSVDSPPRAATRKACAYPQRARAKHIQGSATLSMLVQVDGTVRDVRVLSSEPPGVFDEVAQSCLAGWRFEPAMYEGQPVASRARQTLRFVLD